jgi:serralysin
MGWCIASPVALELAVIHGQTYVVIGAAGSSSLSVIAVAGNRHCIPADHVIDTLGSRFPALRRWTWFKAADSPSLRLAGADDGVNLFGFSPAGTLSIWQASKTRNPRR